MTNFRYKCTTQDFPFFNLFEETFGALNHGQHRHGGGGFPHANVYVDEDQRKLFFEIAVAGYKKEEIDIEVKESILTVKYDKFEEKGETTKRRYMEQRIAERNWTRKWTLSPQVDASSAKASQNDGILTIVFDLEKDNTLKVNIQ